MELLHEGTLMKDNQPLSFQVCILTIEHLPEILRVQDEVVKNLTNHDNLQPLTDDEFRFILEGSGFMVGAFAEKELIAFRALLVPIIDDEHLGLDIGLKEEELQSVIYQEISNVHPAYRGNQLQKTLASIIMRELATCKHRFRYVCCTVAPFNIPSLKDKFVQNMQVAALKAKYGEKLRYIFVRDLLQPEDEKWTETIALPMEDTEAQQQKLAEGFRGIAMEEREGKLFVVYCK